MTEQYKAVKLIGRWVKGEFVGGLSQVEIQHHLAAGNIIEYKPDDGKTDDEKPNAVQTVKTPKAKEEAKADG